MCVTQQMRPSHATPQLRERGKSTTFEGMNGEEGRISAL